MTGPEEPAYVCRKNFHALIIQAVADANMRFLHINARYPGSTHDAYVLANSGLPDQVQSPLEGGLLLGDSGYPLRTWLLTPYQSPSKWREEKFNDSHGKMVVERAFGALKDRFRCVIIKKLTKSQQNLAHLDKKVTSNVYNILRFVGAYISLWLFYHFRQLTVPDNRNMF